MAATETVQGGGDQGALAGLVHGYLTEKANQMHTATMNDVGSHEAMVGYLTQLAGNQDIPVEHRQWAATKLADLANWQPGKKLPKIDLSTLPAANINQPDRQAISQTPGMTLTPPVGPGGSTPASAAPSMQPSGDTGRSQNGTVNAMGNVPAATTGAGATTGATIQPPVAPSTASATPDIQQPIAPVRTGAQSAIGDPGPVPGTIVIGHSPDGTAQLGLASDAEHPNFSIAPQSPLQLPAGPATVIRNPQAPIPISKAGELHLLTPDEHLMMQQAHIATAINQAQQQDPSLSREQAAWRIFHPGEAEPLMEVPMGGTVINKLTGKEVAYGQDKITAGSQKSGYEPQFAPGSHIPTGVKDVKTGAFITPDAAQSIPEAKAVYDQAQAVPKQAQADDIQKEIRKDAEAVKRADAQFDRAVRLSDRKTAEKEVTTAVRNHEDAVDRLKTMQQSYAAALKGDQQAMISVLMNHIGMTLGAQKGARMNQATIHEAEESAPSMGRISAKFDKDGYLQGVVLTPTQMQQMVQLAVEKEKILADHVDRVRTDFASEFGAAGAGGTTATPAAKPGATPGATANPAAGTVDDNGITFHPSPNP